MKRSFFVVLFVCFTLGAVAQTGVNEVNDALKKGNAKSLSAYFHSSIDLTILQKQGTYSKAQAEQIIQAFFDEHKPANYKSNHSGSSGDGSKYMIGTLETGKGNFRVYIYYKTIGGKELIQTLRFESND
jgi:hypothetical protein